MFEQEATGGAARGKPRMRAVRGKLRMRTARGRPRMRTARGKPRMRTARADGFDEQGSNNYANEPCNGLSRLLVVTVLNVSCK